MMESASDSGKVETTERLSLYLTETDWNGMLKKMEECGIEKSKAIEMMKERRAKFVKACETYYSNGI